MRAEVARRRLQGDDGMAMVLVLSSMMVLFLLATTTLAYALQSQDRARGNQDRNAALAAAQAGVDDYIARLNRNDDYGRTWDCTGNPALRGPAAVGNTCGWTTGTVPGWVLVAGQPDAAFHYDVDPSRFNSAGTIQVTATGRSCPGGCRLDSNGSLLPDSRGETRTLDVAIGRSGSTDYLYYTTYEHADPANRTAYPTEPTSVWCSGVDSSGQQVKNIYWWSGRSTAGAGCVEIAFASADVLDGRVHVNDTPRMTGTPHFKMGLETSNPACQTAVAGDPSTYAACQRDTGTPVYDAPPRYAEELYLEDTSAKFATYPGCQYVGPTRIVLEPAGTMRVWSKWSTAATPECGGSAVTSAGGAPGVAVPDGKVVYVSNGGEARECATGEVGDGLPLAGDTNTALADQFCNMGNLYVDGTLDGRLSLAAANSIVVTGDLRLASGVSGDDMLGLIAGNSVQVFHPWIKTVTPTTTCVRYNWSRTQTVASVYKANASNPHDKYGWVDGYFRFDSSGVPYEWVAGSWQYQSSGHRDKEYHGGSLSGTTWNAGSWVFTTNKWRPGTWSVSGNTMQWTGGGWTSHLGGDDWYQGEQWSRGTCAEFGSVTSYAEAPGWPRTSSPGLTIQGSIQTLQHSFYVQNPERGTPQGTLTVFGSLAQKWRGIVGVNNGTTGYTKDYRYDPRLKYSAPPYFPQWSNAKWSARYTGELSPRYS